MKNCILLCVMVLAGFAANAQPPKVPADAGMVFGEKTTVENAITVEKLVTVMQAKEAGSPVDVKITGKVTEVCQKEGCWIKVKSPDGSMMVKMKDHKFLVPVILEGKSIVINGIAETKKTTVAELRHFAEDAGKTKAEIAKITEPKTEITVQAKGILVL
jgi:uncharacterized protein YdeI (BOF family)